MVRFAAFLLFAGLLAAAPALGQTKDQTQLPQSEEPGEQPKPEEPPAPEQPPVQPPAQPPAAGEDLTQPPPADSGIDSDTEETSPDDLSFGEIPDVTVIELTADIARQLKLKQDRWGFDPEITAKILKTGNRIYEVPISYTGREFWEGKKISWKDAFVVIRTLVKYRFID